MKSKTLQAAVEAVNYKKFGKVVISPATEFVLETEVHFMSDPTATPTTSKLTIAGTFNNKMTIYCMISKKGTAVPTAS